MSDEGRAELLREVSLAVLRELREAGFQVAGTAQQQQGQQGPSRASGSAATAATTVGLARLAGLRPPVPLSVCFHLTSIFNHR